MKNNIETAGQCCDKFFILPEGMAAPELTPGNIEDPVNPVYCKREMLLFLNISEIAPVIKDLW
jgi:hypothetical protein